MAFLCYLLAITVALTFVGIVSADYFGEHTYLQEQRSKEDFSGIKVQGLIYCRKDGQLIGLAGAMARITCMTEDAQGYYAGPFTVVSRHTDISGYFLMDLSKYKSDSFTLRECKVHLETPPPGICNIPTNVNDGLTGATLIQYRTLSALPVLGYAPVFSKRT